MNETRAVMELLDGTHPGNLVRTSRRFSPHEASKEFDQFIQEDIPEDWYRFHRLCHLLWVEAKYNSRQMGEEK